MDISAKWKWEVTSKGWGPYVVIRVTLDHDEVPAADMAERFAEYLVDAIVGCFPPAALVKDGLTAIYGNLTPDIATNDGGYGVFIDTHAPAGGVGAPYSDVSPRPAPRSSFYPPIPRRRPTPVKPSEP